MGGRVDYPQQGNALARAQSNRAKMGGNAPPNQPPSSTVAPKQKAKVKGKKKFDPSVFQKKSTLGGGDGSTPPAPASGNIASDSFGLPGGGSAMPGGNQLRRMIGS
jgi:hypothetical protein